VSCFTRRWHNCAWYCSSMVSNTATTLLI